MDHRYAMKLELDEEGDFFMRIPEALVEDLGWIEGTLLDFEEDIDGSVIPVSYTHLRAHETIH